MTQPLQVTIYSNSCFRLLCCGYCAAAKWLQIGFCISPKRALIDIHNPAVYFRSEGWDKENCGRK